MDNGFLTILFYIFIFLILLSSLLKKKPKGTQGKPDPNRQMPPDINVSSKTQEGLNNSGNNPDYNDISKEIENLFKGSNQSGSPNEIKNEASAERKGTRIENYSREEQKSYESKIPDEYEKWPGSGIEQAVQTTAKDLGKIEKDISMIDSKIEEEAKNFEQLLNKMEDENILVLNLREKLNDPQTLKEIIVYNEILGKPKALRK